MSEPKKPRDKDHFREIITKWKFTWMNQRQNDQADFENYHRRAFGIDSNMIHSLAEMLAKDEPESPKMSEPRMPRDFAIDPKVLHPTNPNLPDYYMAYDHYGPYDEEHGYIHVREVLPSPPNQDAESAAEEYRKSIEHVLHKTKVTDVHLAGQSVGASRRTKEICAWLKMDGRFIEEDEGGNYTNFDWADEISRRFFK